MKNEFTVEENRKNACKIQNLAQPLTNKLNILHLTQSLKGIRLQFQQ